MRDMEHTPHQSPANDRTNNVSEIVAIFLGVTRRRQNALMAPLALSESQVSRKLKKGPWTVEDIDRLAEFFGVAVVDFFEDPEVIRRRMLGVSESPWMTMLTADEPQDCEGQLDLLHLGA